MAVRGGSVYDVELVNLIDDFVTSLPIIIRSDMHRFVIIASGGAERMRGASIIDSWSKI